MGHFLVDSIPEKEKIVGMPRQIRIEDPGALYHLLDRGDRREDIFLEDVDRQDFIKILADTCLKTDWQVHSYCLMRNHFHRAVETPQANLVTGMSWLGAAQERSGQAGNGSPITARDHPHAQADCGATAPRDLEERQRLSARLDAGKDVWAERTRLGSNPEMNTGEKRPMLLIDKH